MYDFKVGRSEIGGQMVMQCRQVDLCVQGISVKDCMIKMVNQFTYYQDKDMDLPGPCSDADWVAFSEAVEVNDTSTSMWARDNGLADECTLCAACGNLVLNPCGAVKSDSCDQPQKIEGPE
jgi:hypothetical protein